MAERFEFKGELREELLEYARRLQLDGNVEKFRLQFEAVPKPPRQKLTFRQKIRSFFLALTRLPQTRRRVGALEAELASLKGAVISLLEKTSVDTREAFLRLIDVMNDSTNQVGADLARIRYATAKLNADIETVTRRLQMERLTRQKAFTDFDRRLGLRASVGQLPTAPNEAARSPSDREISASLLSTLESFYFLLEERYRGTREEIKQRLFVYRNDLRAARERTGGGGLVIDIGCGRGELLELLAEDGFNALGVDSNDTQLEVARRHGAAVIHGDAFEHLRSLETDSVFAVTGIHIVEHLPFPELARLMQEVVRVLKKGGVAIFETPNPRNLIVGATTFHFDPTHVRPLPPEVMQVLLETVGFASVETRPLHPSGTLDYMVKEHNLNAHVATLLYGPQDYAVIGVRE